MMLENSEDDPDAVFSINRFNSYYQEKIWPLLMKFEKERPQARAVYRRRLPAIFIVAGIVAVIILMMLLSAFSGNAIFGAAIVGFLAIGATFMWARSAEFDLARRLKARVAPVLFAFFGESFNYQEDPSKGKQETIFRWCRQALLFSKFDDSLNQCSCFVNGVYSGISFFSVMLKLRRKEKDNKKVLFDGVMLGFLLNKSLKSSVIIQGDRGRFGNTINALKFQLGAQIFERVRLEDPLFEEKFEVYGTNQLEARLLLTPAFMERLIDLADMYETGTKKVQCVFFDTMFLIFLPNEKFLSSLDFSFVNSNKVISLYEECTSVWRDMMSIFGIIETLKLDDKTGLWLPERQNDQGGSPGL